MFPSLQSFAKKVLARQQVSIEYHVILERCGLWWYKAQFPLIANIC